MNGSGYWDNVIAECLWHIVKCQCLCVEAFMADQAIGRELRRHFQWYYTVRSDQGLGNQTRGEVYLGSDHGARAA